jgi:hypothetical protein
VNCRAILSGGLNTLRTWTARSPDLPRLQPEFFAAEQAWREAAVVGDDDGVRRAYEKTHRLGVALSSHEWWDTIGSRYQACMELWSAAREGG